MHTPNQSLKFVMSLHLFISHYSLSVTPILFNTTFLNVIANSESWHSEKEHEEIH